MEGKHGNKDLMDFIYNGLFGFLMREILRIEDFMWW